MKGLDFYMYNLVSLPIKLNGEHWKASVIKLNAFTDDIDTTVHTTEFHVFRGQIVEKMEGNIFFLENNHDGNAYVIITDCPDYQKARLLIKDYTVSVDAGTCDVCVASCKVGECEAVCRETYRERMQKKALIAMSNTWGDCNGFSRVCEDFVLKEIDKAAELGLNIVQIDDGWQCGSTADLSRRDQLGRRVFADDFWILDEKRFPRGMKFVSDYAAKKGVKIGLWFAPESHDSFACTERDIAILKNAYDNWGVRFFKLDMYWLENDSYRDSFLKYLDAISAFGDDVAIQLDVTRDARIGYTCGRQYGNIFVENRYTKTHSFFPYRTLKNLWLLSRYVPASRFQFEFVNPALNVDSYDANDEFATPRYSIDYMFASVMLSNPLLWMELQFLSDENCEKLKDIFSFWKGYRQIFSESDVAPVGECPSGRSFTGFHIKHESGEYALVFREANKKQSYTFLISSEATSVQPLLANVDVDAKIDEGALKVSFSDERAYALLKLN